MLKRVLFLVLVLCLPLGIAGPQKAALADGITTPPVGDQWWGSPDLQEDSGRFLAVSGVKNAGLTPDGNPSDDPGKLVLVLLFDEKPSANDVQIRLFDADTNGLWDQRDDLAPVSPEQGITRPYDTTYRLYPDPTGGVARALVRSDRSSPGFNPGSVQPVDSNGIPESGSPATWLIESSALDAPIAGTDAAWYSLYDAEGDASAYNASQNVFVYTLFVTLDPGPAPLTGFELNGFKIAFTGEPRVPRGTLIGFIGGAGDTRTIDNVAQTEDPLPGETYEVVDGEDVRELTNGYTGDWDFRFRDRDLCEDLVLYEGDADWNTPIPALDLSDPTTWFGDPDPTGIPPDDGGIYQVEDPQTGNTIVVDNHVFRIPLSGSDYEERGLNGLVWELWSPGRTTLVLSSYTDPRPAYPQHPSITGDQQSSTYPTVSDGDFQFATLTKDAANAVGPTQTDAFWHWEWHGVDSRNLIWLKASGGLGTPLEGVESKGRIHCGETGVEGAELVFESVPPGLTAPTGVTTNANGEWSTFLLTPGTWAIAQIILPPGSSFVPTSALPQQFVVDDCEGADVDTPGTCETVGTLSGRVYCDNNTTGEFDDTPPPADEGIAGATVSITAFGDVTPTATTTTAADGTYSFTNLAPGTYVVEVFPLVDPVLAFRSALSATSRTEVVPSGGSVQDVDFLFCCYGDLTGRVYCDNDGSQGYQSPPDKPLEGVTVELLRSGNVVATDVTDSAGEFAFDQQAVGAYTVRVDTSTLPAGVSALDPTSQEETISCEATVEMGFRFQCPAAISGHVWRETIDCDGAVSEDDEGIENVEVVLVRLDDPTKGPWMTTTDGTGYYEFSPVDPGTYRVQVDETQSNVVRLKASNPVPSVISPIVVEALTESTDNDFFFCPGTITIRVVQKAHGEACRNVIAVGDTPIQDVEVVLTGVNPVVAPQMGMTDANGEYTWINLEAGDYLVTVDGSQTKLSLYVPAAGAESANVTLPPGANLEVPSVWCEELCKINGHVLRQEEGCDCDSSWIARGPLSGVRVELRQAGDPALLAFAMTDATGFYEFDELLAGSYVVSVPGGQTVLVDMTPTSPTRVTVPECPAVVDFYYGTASLNVEVLVDIDCGGRPDGGLALQVTMEKLDAPGLGTTFQAPTDPTTGMVRFPTAGMNALLPGLWKVSVPPQPGLVAKSPLEQTILLEVCVCEELTFEFCGTGSIVGKVWKEVCNCNGQPDRGELGIEGVEVTLTPANTLDSVRTTLTNAAGEFAFTNVPRGTYTVSVDESQAVLAGLTASSSTTVQVILVPPDEARADFFFCERQPAYLYGYVYEEPFGKCTGEFDEGDTGIAGVTVGLAVQGPTGDWTALPPTLTNAAGRYEFGPLEPGVYRVSVFDQQPLLVDLTATTDTEVGPFELTCASERQIDFGFAHQKLGGLVWLEAAGNCDGVYDPQTDGVIPGVEITIMKLDEPQKGLTKIAYTGANGVYRFDDLPAGTWQVVVTGGVPAGYTPSTDVVREVLVPICKAVRVNFGYCPPLGQICGKAWINPHTSDCDEIFDLGDIPLVGLTVELEKMDEPGQGHVLYTTTDHNGDYCFYRLIGGLYEVRVPGAQPQLANVRPFGPTQVLVTLPPGGSERVDFPYCEECHVQCCVGDLHEVVVETKFWVGYTDDPEHRWTDVYAYFFDGCTRDAEEIDYAGLFYQGAFPGAKAGYNDILTIENVREEDGWAIVRLRLTAHGCWFARGFFGKKCRTVAVWFNGKWNYGKAVFRCECVRPGSWFTWSECCGFPECEEPISTNVLASMILEGQPNCCDARYLTIDTYSWESWVRCERGPRECKEQSESCRCGYNFVELELDYWVPHPCDQHAFFLELEKWGTDTIDGVSLSFTGDEWHGKKKGWNGMVFLTDAWLVSRGEYADLWRVRMHVRACDRPDGNPRALPQQLNLATVFDEAKHDFWLDLNSWNEHCLQLGPWMWEGESMGVNIIRWLNVMDAAWCPPYACDKDCGVGLGYCATCPKPEGCNGTQDDCNCNTQPVAAD